MAELPPRRLAAILHADVVGSTALVRRNETLAHERIQDAFHRFAEVIKHYGGIPHEVRGDALVAEFNRASDAVAAALAFQARNAQFNTTLFDDIQPQLRIGISLGEVVIADSTVTGAGVVLAQRLEQLAEPGGVCIHGTAYETVPRRMPFEYESLGEQEVKGFEEPVRAYAVKLKTGEAIPTAEPRTEAVRAVAGRPVWPRIVGSAIILLIVVGGGVAWWQPWKPQVEPASIERMAFPLPDKPSIAVMPFTNMSDEREQEHFADGMTDDLITDLSKISDLFVIARNSTFAYKGQAVEVRQVAENLGVRYVLEGSVRRAGNTIRVNAQLIDATDGGHVWADRFDGEMSDIFKIQDEFVKKIVEALALNLSVEEEAEITRGQTEDPKAWEEFQKGWAFYHQYTFEGNSKAIEHLTKAVELDPEFGRAYAALSIAYFRVGAWAYMYGPGNVDVQHSYIGEQIYIKAAKLHPTSLLHVYLAADNLWFGHDKEALDEAALAIAGDPNEPEAYIAMAWAKIVNGQPEAGLKFVDTALRLNPSHPNHYDLPRGIAFFAMADLEAAEEVFEEALERNPDALVFAPPLAAIYALTERREEAREMLMRWRPGANQQELETIYYQLPVSFGEHPEVQQQLNDGLDIAALPLEITIPGLIEMLEKGSTSDRILAARKLAWFGPAAEPAVPALIAALTDEDLIEDAAITLGKIGPGAEEAIPALRAVPEDSLDKYYAEEALGKITAQ